MDVWSGTIARTWDQGVVAGTGVVGGILFGEPERHVLVVSHERFLLPANSRRPAPELAAALPTVRTALAGGDNRAAADAVAGRLEAVGIDPDELVWTDPLSPLAQLVWEPAVSAAADYRRSISTTSLGTEVSWSVPGGRMGVRVLAQHGDEFLDVELWSDVQISGLLSLEPVREARSDAATIDTVDYSSLVRESSAASAHELSLDLSCAGLEPGTGISARVAISGDRDFAVTESGWAVALSAGDRLVARLRVSTDAPGPAVVHGEPESVLEFGLHLGEAASDDHVEAVWDAARTGDLAAEGRVLEIAYTAGRRNIIASTGALPPTLQGVWQGTWSPAWSADYTMNGNVQLGTLAAALWTGTPSLLRSLFRLILPFTEDYRDNARALFGAPGMMLPARLTTHGHANHFTRDYPHQFWIGHGNWLLRMAADYMSVTGDRSILHDWLWDYAVGILDFGTAVVEQSNGHISPSYSPENTPRGSDNPLAIDATAEIAALRDGLRVGVWLATLVGDAGRAAEWSATRAALPPYTIAQDGTLAEWGPSWAEHLEHRHASQLHGLWYEVDEAFEDPALRSAALQTIQRKLAWRAEAPYGPPGHQEMAFGLSSIGIAAAALGDAESALQCAVWLARDHFTSALVSTHDQGAIFNLDASGALPAVVAAMLIGSTADELRLLPALPDRWSAGEVTGLTGRGGAVVHRLAWSRSGIDLDLELRDAASWTRPKSFRLLLPGPGVLRTGPGVRQLDEFTLLVTDSARTAVRIDLDPLQY
jgi:hypothetical protein